MNPEQLVLPETPSDPNRRILLCLTGMSPQIVTETLYALSIKTSPAWVPTEIHLITTSEGARLAHQSLLNTASGRLWQFVRDYHLPTIRFDLEFVHVLEDRHGHPLADIRSDEDNEDAADFIVELVRRMTSDHSSSLHVSIAGGRKTMGFYAGYALSLFGRPQDRLSHVLVSSPFESLPDFYYPPPEPVLLRSRGESGELFDTGMAEVTLASIPFVLLRHVLPDTLLQRKKSFRDAVHAVQKTLPPQELLLDVKRREILAGDKKVKLSPTEMAFLCWFARRKKNGAAPLSCPKDGFPNGDYARAFLLELKSILGVMGDTERTEKALKNGMDQDFFEQKRSRLNGKLLKALGAMADPYLIRGRGSRGKSYEIGLQGAGIRFGAVLPPHMKESDGAGKDVLTAARITHASLSDIVGR